MHTSCRTFQSPDTFKLRPLHTSLFGIVLGAACCLACSSDTLKRDGVATGGGSGTAGAAADAAAGGSTGTGGSGTVAGGGAANDAGPPEGGSAGAGGEGTEPPCQGELCPADVTFFAMGDCQYGGGPDADKNFLQISALNEFPGRAWPEGMPSAGIPVATPRGLLLAGDLTNNGRDGRPGDENHNQLGRFLSDYGLTGTEGLLRYPVYEGYGNHDFDPAEEYEGWRDLYPDAITPGVQAVIDRNPDRIGLTNVASEGGHYSWDWGGVHFVNLNLFPGNEPSDHDHTSQVRNPYHSLDFLAEDLAKHVGDTCRPVILMSHFGFITLDPLWWKAEQQEAFWQVAKDYNVIAYIHGHTHDTSLYQWNGMNAFNVGSPYYDISGVGGLGHFSVFRIHGDVFEAADVAWDPNRVPAKAEFILPTEDAPNIGWRFSKTIRRTCEDTPAP